MEAPKDPEKIRYYSKQPLKNEDGEIKGDVTIVIFEGKKIANVDYNCPFCGHDGKTEVKLSLTRKRGRGENYKLEFPFTFECENCETEFEIDRMNPRA